MIYNPGQDYKSNNQTDYKEGFGWYLQHSGVKLLEKEVKYKKTGRNDYQAPGNLSHPVFVIAWPKSNNHKNAKQEKNKIINVFR